MDNDLKLIKSKYGEKMMHLCREHFAKLLDTDGLLPSLLEKYFYNYRTLADDIISQDRVDDFKTFIYEKIKVEQKQEVANADLTAAELLKKAGYILYPECKNEYEIQSFRKYFARKNGNTPVYNGGIPEIYNGEELCTFNGGRLNTSRVWFAVKENIDSIKREDFKIPARQDEYGTSIISIQFTKTENSTLKITNRYNHSVDNSDCTFNNNLDNIIEGLSAAFERDFGVKEKLSSDADFELEGYVVANDGKFYPYNHEINDIYYGPNNIVIDNSVAKILPTDHQILADYFIIDLKERSVSLYDKKIKDSFVDDLSLNKKISIEKGGIIKIEKQDGGNLCLKLNSKKEIVGLVDDSLQNCKNKYLFFNQALSELSLKNLKNCGDDFLYNNKCLTNLYLPQLQYCGEDFLRSNELMLELELPQLRECGDSFFQNNDFIHRLYLPNLEECGDSFMFYNTGLHILELPKLKKCGDKFFDLNQLICKFELPKLEFCGESFMASNLLITKVNLPKLQKCGYGFMRLNKNINELQMPNLEKCGDKFLYQNLGLQSLYLPKLIKCGDSFIRNNIAISSINLPSLEECKDEFLHLNEYLVSVNLPRLRSCGDMFMTANRSMKKLELPQLETCGDYFMAGNRMMKEFSAPALRICGFGFLIENRALTEFNFTNLQEKGMFFLDKNHYLKNMLAQNEKGDKNI